MESQEYEECVARPEERREHEEPLLGVRLSLNRDSYDPTSESSWPACSSGASAPHSREGFAGKEPWGCGEFRHSMAGTWPPMHGTHRTLLVTIDYAIWGPPLDERLLRLVFLRGLDDSHRPPFRTPCCGIFQFLIRR